MDRWRILAVDDDPDSCDLIRMTLETDYDVVSLVNPVHTPNVMEIFEPDLVILDVMMPKVSGFQLIEFLRKEPAYKDIPVVFLTAKGAIKDQKYGYVLGASLYLTKPFQPSRLVKNIRLMFENQQGERKPKKHSLRDVDLRISLQCPGLAGPGFTVSGDSPTPPSPPPPSKEAREELSLEDGRADPWID